MFHNQRYSFKQLGIFTLTDFNWNQRRIILQLSASFWVRRSFKIS